MTNLHEFSKIKKSEIIKRKRVSKILLFADLLKTNYCFLYLKVLHSPTCGICIYKSISEEVIEFIL